MPPYPKGDERTKEVLRWFASGPGRINGFPTYEAIPAEFLSDYHGSCPNTATEWTHVGHETIDTGRTRRHSLRRSFAKVMVRRHRVDALAPFGWGQAT